MESEIIIPLVVTSDKSVSDAQEEILIAADWYKVRENVRISVDLLSSTMNVFCPHQDFIEYLKYSYVEGPIARQQRGA